MQMRIEDLELSLDSIESLVKTLKRIIDNFIQYGTVHDRRYDAPGPSYTVGTEKTVDSVDKYFAEHPNSTIRKAAELLKTRCMEARVKFCKTITEMFESGEIDENKIVFSDEAHFWLNGYFNKQNFRF
ncbi:uncharacterized protein LOC112493941 [Cephus cinctus]|uniref:Uncharacterized protein LOC112493941 n=1 Tax=Cephus cinctus TaxID=211228 RepID=A0AAJ7RBK3_CEPCN|nr:uncharacterized protein LOC112493941 [Cephus cinctus]